MHRDIFVANTSGSAVLASGEAFAFRRGDKFRGDHPLVKACPLFFEEPGDPEAGVTEYVKP